MGAKAFVSISLKIIHVSEQTQGHAFNFLIFRNFKSDSLLSHFYVLFLCPTYVFCDLCVCALQHLNVFSGAFFPNSVTISFSMCIGEKDLIVRQFETTDIDRMFCNFYATIKSALGLLRTFFQLFKLFSSYLFCFTTPGAKFRLLNRSKFLSWAKLIGVTQILFTAH